MTFPTEAERQRHQFTPEQRDRGRRTRFPLSESERFDAKVYCDTTQSGCWLWLGGTDSKGYGRYSVNAHYQSAHRYAWSRANGPIPDGLCVLHRCDVPLCVRPDHLFLGSKADNTADMMRKGRGRPGRTMGSAAGSAKFSDAQVIEIRRRREAGETLKSIAASYRVHLATIWLTVKRKHWRHLP